MSKKSYKQLQNRLYREIKRRIIAERSTVNVSVVRPRIETIRAEQNVVYFDRATIPELLSYTKSGLAHRIGKELMENGYFDVMVQENCPGDPVQNRILVRCELKVVKPERR